MIGIRVDANKQIASGHLMRCLSIADALFSLGENVVFFTSDEFAETLIVKRGYQTVRLNSDWDKKEDELEILIGELKKYSPGMLLVDSYQVTSNYLKSLRETVKLAYLDDLNSFDYAVDLVINYSVYADEMVYPMNKRYLLGTRYAPLRKQFDISEERLNRSMEGRRKNPTILVTMGATDPYFIAKKTVEKIMMEPELSEYRIIVIRGRFWEYSFDDNMDDRVSVMENVEKMADVMLECSVAVSAAGSTLYELCACGVPTVTVSYADNQIGNAKGFADRDIMYYAGDARNTVDLEKKVIESILNYTGNNDIINGHMRKMRELGCSNGAMRLAEELVKYSENT